MANFPNVKTVEKLLPWAGQLVRQLNRQVRVFSISNFTLNSSSDSTTVFDGAVRSASHVSITPTTSSAATEVISTYIPNATIKDGSFIVEHAINAIADRTFSYVIFEPESSAR